MSTECVVPQLKPTLPIGSAGMKRPASTEDHCLVRAAQQGDTGAFEQLVRTYDRAVLRLALHLTESREDAQDIYQEAFLRAYLNLPRFRFECSFYTWIYRIVCNLCIDHLRKKSLRGRDASIMTNADGDEESVLDYVADDRAMASPERNLLGGEVAHTMKHAMRRLSARERMVFELRHYQGMRLRTVAGILNTSEGTIKNTLFRATHKLRDELAELR